MHVVRISLYASEFNQIMDYLIPRQLSNSYSKYGKIVKTFMRNHDILYAIFL